MLHLKAHIGFLLMALPVALLLIPAHTPIGGAPGIAVLLHLLTGFPAGVLLFLINFACFLFAMVALGRSFGFRAIYAACFLSMVVEVARRLAPGYTIDQPIFQWIAQGFASLLMGFGLFWAIEAGYAPAGTTALAETLSRIWNFPVVWILWGIDLGVSIAAGFFLNPGAGLRTFFGACVMYVTMINIERFKTPKRK